jgi:hypothetical protein
LLKQGGGRGGGGGGGGEGGGAGGARRGGARKGGSLDLTCEMEEEVNGETEEGATGAGRKRYLSGGSDRSSLRGTGARRGSENLHLRVGFDDGDGNSVSSSHRPSLSHLFLPKKTLQVSRVYFDLCYQS